MLVQSYPKATVDMLRHTMRSDGGQVIARLLEEKIKSSSCSLHRARDMTEVARLQGRIEALWELSNELFLQPNLTIELKKREE